MEKYIKTDLFKSLLLAAVSIALMVGLTIIDNKYKLLYKIIDKIL